MVIDGRGQIGLYLCTVFPDGQFGTILDVTLDQHHAVRLTEPFGRAAPGLFVHLHLLPPIAGFVDMPLQGRPFQNTGSDKTFCFQDVNDLGN